MDPEIWNRLSPTIVHYVETLVRHGQVGIGAGNIYIKDVLSSCPSITLPPKGDRFKVALPYAGCFVTWEVLFDCNHPDDPPDFIFDADQKGFAPELETIESLINWDHYKASSLLIVLQELLGKYRLYQQQLVESNYRLKFEYESLLEHTDVKPEEVEMHISRTENQAVGPVHFLIKMSVDFSRIPSYLTKDDPGEDNAVLLLMFPYPGAPTVNPQLHLSPRVENALGGSANLRIPPFPNGGVLIDYVPKVNQLLKNKVEQVVQSYEKRKEYIASFLSHFARSLIEYDAEGFSRISFLFEWNDFFFIFEGKPHHFFKMYLSTISALSDIP
ncbi:BRISC and BRCA1-A complex member 2 [Octopus bimaculoides]|uniref:BRISC and BRCA1-A complex member 2 n=1 Tax=Octopus bimaculoides TaxID=37653 RepID=A0A0L8GNJ3_OCTBM|nr:BRISC and BRCA1-A complex member 2 [Octopus bimaculoides]|eukprot:XP_014779468.1 PREDICTED: BRCA1-A complex subunit BRE-like [Octopus bimaculoides]